MMKESTAAGFWKIQLTRPVFLTVVFYLCATALMEVVGFYSGPLWGAIGNALLIFLLINQTVWMRKTASYRILPPIALLPLFRLLSFVLPVAGWPLQINYVLVALPLLVTAASMIFYRKIPLADLGFNYPVWRSQLLIALSGLPLGYMGFLILHPSLMFLGSGPVLWTFNLLVVFVCIAFAEEFIFRGIFLRFMTEVSDRFALLVSGVMYGIFNIGSQSLLYALYMGLVGWLFAFFVIRTRSIWGVVIAHFLLIAGMGLFWPQLF